MTTTVTIPTLETERLILRAPRMEDTHVFVAFLKSDRAKYIGGPYSEEDDRIATRIFGHVAGLWVMRGYGLFIAERKDTPGKAIGGFGPWHPVQWPEPEFGWSLYDADSEHQGFVTEAMRVIIPWTFEHTGFDTFTSYIDTPNENSIRVAEALGAVFDDAATKSINGPDGLFHDPDDYDVLVYRHTKGRLQ